ncbi:MAG: hypothetical protein A2Y97_03860 [Nitrospirae bacterium RBG_13_39_12]|nr:MAG: hypothetical protein A2Y97_03860 [Nitrospirae bacterium RBG_13_39_12]
MNRLSIEKSPYLRHASHQKIDWYPWSDEAFIKAKKKDKPVFLSSGAIWCHWCHVMAKECFENEDIIRLLNENFINIKLDRDERPDIDRRYQQAVASMGFGGGWPLSVFLTPDRKPFFGGTYFPPDDAFGRPGFKKVLKEVSDFYNSNKQKISEYSQKLMDSLKSKPFSKAEINETSLNNSLTTILSQFDPQNGGFGSSPKFPMPGAIEFLINRSFFAGKETIGHVIKKTLESMAKGGFHDQIGGGFHRYSVDGAWIIPHFEKMADDNAWLLRNYIDAYLAFGYEYFKDVAEKIISFINDVLSDPGGGFYTSQDADVTPDDEGGYFTWTDKDFRRVLNDEEYRVLSLHLLHERGAMHHDKSKKVLFVSMDTEKIAGKTGMDVQTVSRIISLGKEKLLRERFKRESPFVDRTFYTSLNGMLISAYLKAFRILKDKKIKDFALRSLKKIIRNHFINNKLFHTEGIKAVLDDYIHFTDALIAAYEVTGTLSYLTQADELMELCIKKFWDDNDGGFFDTEEEILGVRLKEIEDIPHSSANSLGIILLIKLYNMTEKAKYYEYAETALKLFSSNAKNTGILSGYYFCAVDAYFNMLKLTLQTAPDSKLGDIALSSFRPYMSIVHGEEKGCITPCIKNVCYDPLQSPDSLREFFNK